ncbi:MAG: RagB/SusD family nutrient uptake outer membrane protein [Tannerella sp.]|nr:RagB/SusD family nutrient uptake outer membrane protein [Tannerella sp.]
MKRIFSILLSMALTGITLTGCNDDLTTNSYTDVSDSEVLKSVPQLNKVLTSAYRQLYFNNKSDRVFAGLPGFQMYVDLGGSDILCHTNMGGSQLTTYQYSNAKTQSNSEAERIWTMCYSVINLSNIILTNIDGAAGNESEKQQIKGQALAMRAIQYFHLIQNYQQTYVIARNKRGVILRTSSDDEAHKGFATVEEIYSQIVSDLTSAKSLLANYHPEELWFINSEICSGILARVYLVMQNWSGAYTEAKTVYDSHSTLLTRDEYRSGFDEMISGGYDEVVWAMKYTPNNNLGGSTQFNFWYNQDESYGEGYADGPIYSFLDFFADSKFEALFEKTDDRYQFWKREKNANSEINTKWAFDKYKHYGLDKGTVIGSATYPEVCLMRGAEMLLIMAESAANSQREAEALQLLNRLQTARNATPTRHASGNDLLEDIYVERRKELICEGQSGFYDLVRLQKRLERYGESETNPGGHYIWGLQYINGYPAAPGQPCYLESNDYRFFCQIPQMEMLNNDAVTEADQNPYGGK